MCGKSVCLVFLVLLIAPGIAPAQLLVHYPFDETSGLVAADTSGKGNDGRSGRWMRRQPPWTPTGSPRAGWAEP
jgi:hypothetical protein